MGLLITELNEDVAGLVVESRSAGSKKYYIEGVFMQGNVKNRNGRRYDPGMLNEEVQRYIREQVANKSSIGELGHPPTPTLSHERACHLIENLSLEGTNWIGKARVLTELPMGKIVKGLIDEGVRFGVSSRGVGGLRKTPTVTEVYNYKLSTAADVVTDPSAPDAWVNGIMENASWVLDAAGNWVGGESYESTIKALDKPKRLVSEDTKLKLFQNFLTEITEK